MALKVQTIMPAVVTPDSQVIVTDIDNDGYLEVIILDSNAGQLSIAHQFSYSEFTLERISSSVWPKSNPDNTEAIWNDSTTRWWTGWATKHGLVPPPVAPGGWVIGPGDVIVAGDLDGDGIDELFIYNLTSCFWGILKWNSQKHELQTVYKILVAPDDRIVPVGQLEWGAAFGDQYIMIPNMHAIIPAIPANVTGILLFNSETLNMGMIWFSAQQGEFLQPWPTSNTIPGWTLAGTNEFFVANFADPVRPSITVYDQDKYIALLTWNGWQFSTPSAQGTQAGHWGFDPADQHQCGDLDGDGMAEIFVYNLNTKFLGALQWQGGQLQSLAVQQTVGTAPNDWTVNGDDKYYLLNIPGGASQIYAYSPSSAKVAVLEYDQGAFVCKWVNTWLSPNNEWPVSPADSFYVGFPSNPTAPKLFTLSNQGPATNPEFTLGAATWDGANLQIVSSATVPVPSWSPAFLASAPPAYVMNGPPTNFPSFEGDQQDIYTYISGLFPAPGQPPFKPPITSVRAVYGNDNYENYFQDYGTALQNNSQSVSQVLNSWTPAPNPAWQNSDWNKVLNTIADECTLVTGVHTFYDNLTSVGSTLYNFQSGDLSQVTQYINELADNDSSSEVLYWVGQFFVACLWGMAAAAGGFFPLEEAALGVAMGVMLSTSASFLGSILSFNPTQKTSLAAGQMELDMQKTFDQSVVTGGLNRAACLEDGIKLKICAGLIGSEWAIHASFPATVPPLTATDRMLMYQQLMPFYFTIVYGTRLDANQIPVLYTTSAGIQQALRHGFDSYVSLSDFKNSDLYTDLFTTAGVSLEDFFVGNGGWALIPRTLG